jgi:hypothetical protein
VICGIIKVKTTTATLTQNTPWDLLKPDS